MIRKQTAATSLTRENAFNVSINTNDRELGTSNHFSPGERGSEDNVGSRSFLRERKGRSVAVNRILQIKRGIVGES